MTRRAFLKSHRPRDSPPTLVPDQKGDPKLFPPARPTTRRRAFHLARMSCGAPLQNRSVPAIVAAVALYLRDLREAHSFVTNVLSASALRFDRVGSDENPPSALPCRALSAGCFGIGRDVGAHAQLQVVARVHSRLRVPHPSRAESLSGIVMGYAIESAVNLIRKHPEGPKVIEGKPPL